MQKTKENALFKDKNTFLEVGWFLDRSIKVTILNEGNQINREAKWNKCFETHLAARNSTVFIPSEKQSWLLGCQDSSAKYTSLDSDILCNLTFKLEYIM